MKIAKPYKILALFVVFVISAALFFAFSFTTTAHAEVSGSDYFSGGTVVFNDDKAEITFDSEETAVEISHKLDLEDFAVTFYLPNDMADDETFTAEFTTDSLIKTGNKVADGEFSTTVKNQVVFKKDGLNLTVKFNGGTEKSVTTAFDPAKPITVYTVTAPTSEYLAVNIKYDGADIAEQPAVVPNGKYYIDATFSLAGNVSFSGALGKTFKIESINQKYSAGETFATNKFVQDFVMTAGNADFANKANAKAYLPDAFYNYNGNIGAGVYTAIYGYRYTKTVTAYSFLNVTASEYKIKDNAAYEVEDDNVYFTETSANATDLKTVEIKKGSDVVCSYDFYVVEYSADDTAPKYNGNVDARDSFAAYVKGLVADAKANEKTEITIEKSKIASLVEDDYSSFALMTTSVTCWSNNSSDTSSSLKISLTDSGDFRYIILVTDFSGNAMEKEQFFYQDAEDTNKELKGVYGQDAPAGIGNYIFGFTYKDESKLTITVGNAGTGYKGVSYSCSAFTIDGKDYTANYKLYYSATQLTADAEGWTEITPASKATDESKDYGDFTYDEIQKINYDGTLGFTPDRVGFYKFECKANSTDFIKSEEESVVFEVKEQVKTVKPASQWLKNNVVSVVFLSIGTLSLIGIIVLLFIKPKDEDAVEK